MSVGTIRVKVSRNEFLPSPLVGFFKIENKPIKSTNGKRKFKRMLSFLFVDQRELFALKWSFEEFNLVFFTADQSAWLVLKSF